MSKRWILVAGALFALCAAPPVAMATGETTVTLKMGSAIPTGDFSGVATSGSTVGLAADYKVTKWLAAGVAMNYFRTIGSRNGDDITVIEPTTGNPVGMTLSENWTLTGLSFFSKAYVLPRGRLAPYVRAGAGTYTVRYGLDVSSATATTTAGGNEQQTKFGLNGGAGIAYRIVGGTSLGLEGLYHMVFAQGTNVTVWTTGVTLGFGTAGTGK